MTYLTAILIDVFFGLRCGRAAELIGQASSAVVASAIRRGQDESRSLSDPRAKSERVSGAFDLAISEGLEKILKSTCEIVSRDFYMS